MHERIHHIMSFPGKGASSNDELRQEVLRSSSVSFNFTMIWAWPPKNQQEWGYTWHFNISKLNTLYTLSDLCCHRNPSSGKQATIPGATKAMLRLVSALHREPFQDLKFPQMARSDRSDCRHGIQRQNNGETEILIGHIRLQKRWNEINSPRLRDSRMISLPTEPYRTTMNHSAFWGSLVILRHLFFNNRLTTISSCDVAAQNLESSRIHPLGAVALNAFLHHTFSSLHLLRQRHRLNHCEPKSSGRSFL